MNKLKGLFSTPARAIVSTICIMIVLGVAGIGTAFTVYSALVKSANESYTITQTQPNTEIQDNQTQSDTLQPAEPEQAAQPQQSTVPEKVTYIGVNQAKAIALSHAGVSENQITFQKAKLEDENNRAEYDVEFYANGIEYEYEIDAISGDILEFDSEYED